MYYFRDSHEQMNDEAMFGLDGRNNVYLEQVLTAETSIDGFAMTEIL